jgi:tetratricopeptide (TPR) repeat protein
LSLKLYHSLLRLGKHKLAEKEIKRLIKREPDLLSNRLLLAELYQRTKRLKQAQKEYQRIKELNPYMTEPSLRLADMFSALSTVIQGKKFLERASLRQPFLFELRRLKGILEQREIMEEWRIDGLKKIEEFKGLNIHYPNDSVMVLDRTVTRIFDDMSSISLVHNIVKVQTGAGVKNWGQISLPEDSKILLLRTIKADGRILDAQEELERNTKLLPNLKEGDYIEYEYLLFRYPSFAFAGGYEGERFYFQSHNVPFHHSELKIIAPARFDLKIDGRGAYPPPKIKKEGTLKIWTFLAKGMEPFYPEPSSISSQEYLPSVRPSLKISWQGYKRYLFDVLKDKFKPSQEMYELALRIKARAESPAKRAKILYHWVVDNITLRRGLSDPASYILAQTKGERTILYFAMLRVLGIPCELALVRDISADHTETQVPDPQIYTYPLVRIYLNGKPKWIGLGNRFAPFGYLPSSVRGGKALMVIRRKFKANLFETVPRPRIFPDRRKIFIKIRLKKDGKARIKVREKLKGRPAIALRGILSHITFKNFRKRFESEYLSQIFEGVNLKVLKIKRKGEVYKDLELEYEFITPTLIQRRGKKFYLKFPFPAKLMLRFGRISNRKTPLVLDGLDFIHVSVIVTPPQGMKLSLKPTKTKIGNKRYWFSFRSKKTPQGIKIEKKLYISSQRIYLKEYSRFISFCQKVDKIESWGIEMALTKQSSIQTGRKTLQGRRIIGNNLDGKV